MECKNCKTTLRTDFYYCPNCGGKVVLNRITFKGLLSDFYERYFNLDNTFLITFKKLTTRPEEVIDAYIQGVRRKYMNPMSYIAISLALSGILLYVMRHFVLDNINFDIFNTNMNTAGQEKIMDFTMEFSSLLYVLYIPIIAIAGILSLNSRNYNLPEYMVASTYILSHFSILTFPISIIIGLFFADFYLYFSFIYIALMLGYIAICLARLHPYPNFFNRLLRMMIFVTLFIIGYFGITIAIQILMFITGQLSWEDFRPQKT